MDLRSCLQDIYERRGILTPAVVLEEASGDKYPQLRSHFDWDNETAGHSHRLNQARRLIRVVKIPYKAADESSDARTVRAFQAVRTDRGHEFRPAREVAEDPFLRKMLLADMQRDWQTMKRRWERFAEFAEMVRADLDDLAG